MESAALATSSLNVVRRGSKVTARGACPWTCYERQVSESVNVLEVRMSHLIRVRILVIRAFLSADTTVRRTKMTQPVARLVGRQAPGHWLGMELKCLLRM